MPLFDYECTQCGTVFEKLAKADEPVRCPNCLNRVNRRLLSAPKKFDLKGGGYYETDFKNK